MRSGFGAPTLDCRRDSDMLAAALTLIFGVVSAENTLLAAGSAETLITDRSREGGAFTFGQVQIGRAHV